MTAKRWRARIRPRIFATNSAGGRASARADFRAAPGTERRVLLSQLLTLHSFMVNTLSQPSSIGLVTGRDVIVAVSFVAAAIALMFDAWRDIVQLGMRQEELSYVFLAPVV